MELVSNETFLTWAKSHEIAPDDRYEEPRCLVYVPHREFNRFWTNPVRGTVWPRFLHHILTGLQPWCGGYLWPRGGRMLPWGDSDEPHQAARRATLKFVGIPDRFVGAVRFEPSELGELLVLLLTQMAVVWDSVDDLFIVPEHAKQIIGLSHHEVIHVNFAAEDLVGPFVKQMAKRGFRLPTTLPDASFKRPGWMREEQK